MNTGFLYLGSEAIGWLQPDGQLLLPLVIEPAGRELSFDVKRDYLLRSLAQFQPDACAILLDGCSENISIIAPHKTLAGRPFFTAPDLQPSRLSESDSTGTIDYQAGAPVGLSARLQDPDELMVAGRLQHKGDRVGLWPGSRQRLPIASRRVAYQDQYNVLEWQTLLQGLVLNPVDIFSYTLITEFLLQPLILDLPAVLIVSTQPDGSLRHLFFQNSWLRFSRLVPTPVNKLEDNLESSVSYVCRHLGYTATYPVYHLPEADGNGKRRLQLLIHPDLLPVDANERSDSHTTLSQSDDRLCLELRQAQVPGAYAALKTSLLQRQREFHFGVRRRAIDKLKRWRIQSAGMRQQAASQVKARRNQTVLGVWFFVASVLGVWQLAEIAGTWQQKRSSVQQLHSVQSEIQTRRSESGTEIALSGRQLQRLVSVPGGIYRQSYVEPIAALFKLQTVMEVHPLLILSNVSWQRLQRGGEQWAADVLQGSAGPDGDYLPGNDRTDDQLQTGAGVLQVSVRGQIDLDPEAVLDVAAVSSNINEFESFLQHLRTAFTLQSVERISYPFGINPGARLSLDGEAVKHAQRFLPDQVNRNSSSQLSGDQAVAAFAIDFVLTQSMLTELLLEISTRAQSGSLGEAVRLI